MIPKVIHYCWFGRNPKPDLYYKCRKSWEKKCPDYQIVEWNEDNFDISTCPLYVRQAYAAKKWAFVTDYVRLHVIYENGGVYLDTDVELKKSLDHLLKYSAFFGFGELENINTGLGFGAEKGMQFVKELMDDYNDIPFVKESGELDLIPCPIRNTMVFLRHGLVKNNKKQILDGNILVLPMIYLCPINLVTNRMSHSFRTISIHWFAASWLTEKQKQDNAESHRLKKQLKRDARIRFFKYMPNRILRKMLGVNNYEKFKAQVRSIFK